ncbi:MAG: hypothetical protein JWM47_1892 [Acidimicrobiales bacterium]|nr:hypothetical protein [Acidimicrobiales bacterium]
MGYNGPVSLKRELENPGSPIRRFLDRRLPETTTVLDPWRKALRNVKPHLPPDDPTGGAAPNAVLGHAINARVAWDFAPADRPDTRAGAALLVADGASAAMVDDVLARLAGPVPQHPYDAARLAWFAGLFDRAQRSQRWDEAWYQPVLSAATADELLLQVPAHWAADIVAVERAAARPLAALRGDAASPTAAVSASFAGSPLVGGAEADLVVEGTVVDLKVTATTKTRLRDLHQVLVLALLDWDDAHHVTGVALAPVRFGVVVRWDLAELLAQLAGGPLGVADLRADLRAHLEAAP